MAPPEGYLTPEPAATEPEVADGQTVPVTIALPRDPAPAVAGRVVDEDGNGVPDAWVTAEPQRGIHIQPRRAKSDAEGRFFFKAVPAGSRVRARKGNVGTAEAVVTRGVEEDLLVPVVPDVQTTLVVTAEDTDGKPVKGARVHMTFLQGDGGMQPLDAIRVTDDKGRCVIEGLQADGRYTFTVAAPPGYTGGPKDEAVALKPGVENKLNVELKRAR
jgi:hypothetical protein